MVRVSVLRFYALSPCPLLTAATTAVSYATRASRSTPTVIDAVLRVHFADMASVPDLATITTFWGHKAEAWSTPACPSREREHRMAVTSVGWVGPSRSLRELHPGGLSLSTADS